MTTVSLPESLISTLPGSYYTDATIFAMEQEKIFESMWFCAVRAADLDKPGCLQDRSGRARERADHAVPQRGGAAPSSTSADIAARSCAPRRPAKSSARSSAPTMPGPTTSTAS